MSFAGQWQENDRVGVFLPQSVFTHGQLYTSFSRGKRARGLRVFVGDHKDGLTDITLCIQNCFKCTVAEEKVIHITLWTFFAIQCYQFPSLCGWVYLFILCFYLTLFWYTEKSCYRLHCTYVPWQSMNSESNSWPTGLSARNAWAGTLVLKWCTKLTTIIDI